jgi:hypothetical protein
MFQSRNPSLAGLLLYVDAVLLHLAPEGRSTDAQFLGRTVLLALIPA